MRHNFLPKDWHPDIWIYNPILWVREPWQWIKYLALGGGRRKYWLASDSDTPESVLLLLFFYSGDIKVRIALTQNPNLPVYAQYGSLMYGGPDIPQAMAASGALKIPGIAMAFISEDEDGRYASRYRRALKLVAHRLPKEYVDVLISQDRDGRYTKCAGLTVV